MRTFAVLCILFVCLSGPWACAEAFYESSLIFDPKVESHGHVHASCIVECPNEDLRVVWYENGPELPPPYYAENRDKADNVRIGGSMKGHWAKGWAKPFVMADTFGVADDNPCMVVDREKRLWLFYPTLLGVPKWTWGSALLRYRISSDYRKPVPVWSKQEILIPRPEGLKQAVDEWMKRIMAAKDVPEDEKRKLQDDIAKGYQNPLIERLGWMPRAHPIIRSDGALLLPLANENFAMSFMAITKDGGESWTLSKPVPDAMLTQPTLVEYPDGQIVAFFRNGGAEHRIKRSESNDGGMTWGPVTLTDRPHPGAGIEAILLRSGRLLLVYNDKEGGARDKLAVSLSSDRGLTWTHTRHLENTPERRFDYPSVVQGKDGTIHATYSFDLATIKYAHFNEEWIEQGD